MAHRRSPFILLGLSAAVAAGCRSPYIHWPDLYHPGTAQQQRAVAEQFDPYPSPDTGPEIVGGRPLGYTRPLTEEEWARRYARPDGGAVQPVVVPSLPSSPVFTTPYPPTAPPVTVVPSSPPAVSPSGIQPRSPY